jgi:hypothetical protein
VFDFLKPKNVILLRFESADGWDLLGVYSDYEQAEEGLMAAIRRPEFRDGTFFKDKVPLNNFWPDSFAYKEPDGGN